MKLKLLGLLILATSAHAQSTLTIPTATTSKSFQVSDHFTAPQLEMLVKDFAALQHIAIQKSELAVSIFGEESKDYLDWIAKRIKHIDFVNVSPTMRHGQPIGVIVAMYANRNGKYKGQKLKKGSMLLGQEYFEESRQVDRVKVLVHEARHADGLLHVRCKTKLNPKITKNLQKVKGACDKDELGAYSAEAVFLIQLAAQVKNEYTLNIALRQSLDAANRIRSHHSRSKFAEELRNLFPSIQLEEIKSELGL